MKNRNLIITASTVGTIALYMLFHSEETGLCNLYCGPAIDRYQNVFFIFPVVLAMVLLTLCFKDTVFKMWWKFAKIAIPLAFIALTAVSLGILHSEPAGSMGWGVFFNDAFDLTAMSAIYALFILGSLVQIVRGYRRK